MKKYTWLLPKPGHGSLAGSSPSVPPCVANFLAADKPVKWRLKKKKREKEVCLSSRYEKMLDSDTHTHTHPSESFILARNIYWFSTMYQVSFSVLEIKQWRKQTNIPDLRELTFLVEEDGEETNK